LKDIYQKFGSFRELGMDRYTTLRSAFNPSIDEILEICSLLRTTFVEFVDNVELAVVDESVLAYQPSKKSKKWLIQMENPFLLCTFQENLILMDWKFSWLQLQ
jgi:hypothetical protein